MTINFITLYLCFLFQQSEAERKNPFAFSILNHSNLGLLEALLSVIFRPHNSYCIYVDAKASDKYKVSTKNKSYIIRKISGLPPCFSCFPQLVHIFVQAGAKIFLVVTLSSRFIFHAYFMCVKDGENYRIDSNRPSSYYS